MESTATRAARVSPARQRRPGRPRFPSTPTPNRNLNMMRPSGPLARTSLLLTSARNAEHRLKTTPTETTSATLMANDVLDFFLLGSPYYESSRTPVNELQNLNPAHYQVFCTPIEDDLHLHRVIYYTWEYLNSIAPPETRQPSLTRPTINATIHYLARFIPAEYIPSHGHVSERLVKGRPRTFWHYPMTLDKTQTRMQSPF